MHFRFKGTASLAAYACIMAIAVTMSGSFGGDRNNAVVADFAPRGLQSKSKMKSGKIGLKSKSKMKSEKMESQKKQSKKSSKKGPGPDPLGPILKCAAENDLTCVLDEFKELGELFEGFGEDIEDLIRALVGPPDPYVPQYIEHLPQKNMTGLEPDLVQLLSTISMQLYNNESSVEQFNFTGNKYGTINSTYYESNGIFECTNSPFVVVVVDHTLIIGWRGSTTLFDWIRDFSFNVGSSSRWGSLSTVVKAQGGYLSLVEDQLVTNEEFLLNIIEKQNITRIISTGHSLGGGVAQVAHLWLEGSLSNDTVNGGYINPKWHDLRLQRRGNNTDLTVFTMAFEAPSTTLFVASVDDDLNQRGRDFLNQCGVNMITTCFGNDLVPRMAGNYNFAVKILTSTLERLEELSLFTLGFVTAAATYEMVTAVTTYRFLKNFHVYSHIDNRIGTEKESCLLNIADQYQHIGKILYYANMDAKPEIYVDDRDGGFDLDDGTDTNYPQFDSIHPIPASDTISGYDDSLYYDHMAIVAAPGLTFSFEQWMLSHIRL